MSVLGVKMMSVLVIHDTDRHQFKTDSENACAYLAYAYSGSDVIDIHTTYVPEALRGKNIAGELVAAAIDFAKQNNLKIIPTCSYVARYMERKGLQDLVQEA